MFRPLISWMKAHSLLTYFGLTLLFTWGTCIPLILSLPVKDARYIPPAGRLLELIGLWGPALSAVLTTAITKGMPGLKELFGRLLIWRVPVRWYLMILFGLPAIVIGSALLHAQISGQPISPDWSRWPLVVTIPLSMIINGWYVCEELGWRGFALPRLQERRNALVSSLILGLFWDAWHLPYFMGVKGLSAGVPFTYYFVLIVTTAIIMTWIYNHTKGSLLVAVIFHYWLNFCVSARGTLLPQEDQAELLLATDWLMVFAAMLIVAASGYRSLNRHPERSELPELSASRA